jgi:glycosyltransferase involved in cell wall biosynthesis
LRAVFLTLDDLAKRMLYPRATGYLTVSNATKRDMVEAFRLRGDRIFVSGDGVDFERLSSSPPPATKVYDAIFVGRVTGAKGVDVLLDAWRMVNRLRSEARLLIVGGGEPAEVGKYRRRIEQLGLQKTVLMEGFVPDGRLVELLRSSKVFVLPSYREGFGLSVAEAMACGLPVVVSDIPSLRETFSGVASFFPPGDVERLSEEILRLLEDDRLRGELGRRNELFVRRYEWRSVAERELGFMMGLLGRK